MPRLLRDRPILYAMPPLLALALLAPRRVAAADDAARLTPGFHDQIACAADPAVHYALHLPPQYAQQTERRFPVLFCQHPGGKPSADVQKHAAWADRFGVVVVGIIGPANGMDQGKKNHMADTVIKALAETGVRLHPTLRFTFGVSGGSADGQRLARRMPATFAGLCCVAEHGTGSRIADKDLAIGIVHGGKDPICNPHGVFTTVFAHWKTQGNPLRWTLSQLAGHTSGPPGASTDMLTWLLWTGRLTHPGQTEAELAQHRTEASAWAAEIVALRDPAQQRREAEILLSLPVKDLPGVEAVAQRWQALVGGAAAKLPPADQLATIADALAGERWEQVGAGAKTAWILTGSASGPQALPDAVRQPMEAAVAKLQQNPAAARDWELRRKLRAVVQQEIDGGSARDAQGPAAAAYAALAKEEPANRWCVEAAAHAQRLGGGGGGPVDDGSEKAPGAP